MFSNNIFDYEFLSALKDGKYGTLYRVNYIKEKQLYFAKEFSLEQKRDELNILGKELFHSRQFKHINIYTALHSFVSGFNVYILYPFIRYGNCELLLENVFTAGFPETLIALILKDILSALLYIHTHLFVHGSIRASNILLDGNRALLANFQSCRSFIDHGKRKPILHGILPGVEENLNWVAPEVLDQNLCGFTEKSDVYSLGICSCELANGFRPYLDAQPTLMYTEKIRGNIPSLLDRSTFLDVQGTVPYNYFKGTKPQENYSRRTFSDDFHQYIEICLNRHPSSRWSVKKLMTHSFFKQCRHLCISDQIINMGIDFDEHFTGKDTTTHGEVDVCINHCTDIQWNF
ncbi:STE20-related kinase adapter protein stlk [Drosophila tropicalis]|uniref:STE20-related kinase adapter protein stlk n=1 Tax=Drosophila tropicalis TaxID=46794 RepID=UPI0035ABCBA3